MTAPLATVPDELELAYLDWKRAAVIAATGDAHGRADLATAVAIMTNVVRVLKGNASMTDCIVAGRTLARMQFRLKEQEARDARHDSGM